MVYVTDCLLFITCVHDRCGRKKLMKVFDEFIIYAFDIMDNLGTKWWQQDKTTMRVYKQMLFPAGIQLSPDKKVYIPEISAIYRYGSNKKAPEGTDFTRLEGPVRLELTTPCLKGRCSNQLSYGPLLRGG